MPMASPPDLASLRAVVSRHFRVYDAQEDKIRGTVVARRFYIMYPPGEFDARYEAVRAELKALDPTLLAFLRRDGGEDILFVAERPPDRPQNIPLRVILLLATIVTTTMAGAFGWHGYTHGFSDLPANDLGGLFAALWQGGDFLMGFLVFSLPLLLILGIHESAHYLVARRRGLRATLPMFIPAPILSIGTFGAFISLKDPLPDRKALFDVGVSGPLAGFFAALPVVVLGMFLTDTNAVVFVDHEEPAVAVEMDGASWSRLSRADYGVANGTFEVQAPGHALVNVTANQDIQDKWTYHVRTVVTFANGTVKEDVQASSLKAGKADLFAVRLPANATRLDVEVVWATGVTSYGDPLLVQGLRKIWPAPAGTDYLTHPTFFAGWVGLLITGINLLPTGQLDGGHVSRAVFGENARHVSRLALFLLVALAMLYQTWIIMALFVLLTGLYHPPPLNDRTPIDRKRQVLAVFVLLVLALTFVPIPFQV